MSFSPKFRLLNLIAFTTFYIASVTVGWAKFKGPFLGVHGGIALLTGVHKYTNATPQEGKVILNDPGYIAGLQAGYSKIIIGVELYFSKTGINTQKNLQVAGGTIEGQVTIQHRSAMGLAVLSGLVLNPKVALYGKLAIETNKFNLKYNNLTFQTPTTVIYDSSLRGIVPGAGIFYKLTKEIVVGGEYDYSLIKKTQPRSDNDPVAGVARGFSFSPNEHRLMVKVNYIL
jgi:opacity protein-like surface antigen